MKGQTLFIVETPKLYKWKKLCKSQTLVTVETIKLYTWKKLCKNILSFLIETHKSFDKIELKKRDIELITMSKIILSEISDKISVLETAWTENPHFATIGQK